MASQKEVAIIGWYIFLLMFIAALAWGWIVNIFKIVGADFGNVDGELVIRVIGVVVAPIGAIMGYV